MRTTLPLIVSLTTGIAHAQEVPAPSAEALQEQVAQLEAEVLLVRGAAAEKQQMLAKLESLLDAAATLTDRSRSDADKIAAVQTIAEVGDVRAVPFLKLAADRESTAVKIALLQAAPVFSGDERIHNMVRWLSGSSQPESVRLAALPVLDEAAVPDAPQLLMAIAGSRSESDALKAAAAAQLRANHADFLRAQGGVQQEAAPLDGNAVLLFSGTSAAVGGLLLASVGQLGQTDAGPAIGAIGGALIGGGTGLVYARSNTLTLDDALQYTTAATWGTIYGGQAAFIASADSPVYPLSAGATLGGIAGLVAMNEIDPGRSDIAEVSGAMVLGNQTLAGLARLGDASDEVRVGLGMVGQSIGAGAGLLLRESVTLDEEDGALIASAGLAGGWLGVIGPLALGIEENIDGVTQTLIPLSMIAAAGVSQVSPVPLSQTLTADYGLVSGNLLGIGLPLLLVDAEGSLVAQGALAGGLVGGVAGAAVHDRITIDAGDQTFIPVSTALLTAEAGAISYVLSEKVGFDREGGLILTTAGAGAVASGLLSQQIEVDPAAPLLVSSAAGWGVFYGGLIPVAIGLEGQPEDLVLAITATSDVFMAAAVISQRDSIGLDPRATVLPQLGGVGGSVIGTLGTALFTSEPQGISTGALIGSGVGVAIGVGLERRYGSEWIPRASARPEVRLVSSPAVIDAEEAGLTLGIAVEGW